MLERKEKPQYKNKISKYYIFSVYVYVSMHFYIYKFI